jgi:ribosomal peptide maturation radical SAM protein 1
MTHKPVDVVLVRMPYSEVSQPSLALGLLKAVCDRHGLTSRVLPANLWFSEEIGPSLHQMLYQAYSTTLIGEWTFSGVLFPDFHVENDEPYLRRALSFLELDGRPYWRYIRDRHPYVDGIVLLRTVRSIAADFVERVADRVLALEPRIVGCSSTFQQHCASLALLRTIKQRCPDVVTMIGGANCEGDLGRATFERFPWVDFVCSGEADGFFGPLCEKLVRSGPSSIGPGDVPDGVWSPFHRLAGATTPPAALSRADAPSTVSLIQIIRRTDAGPVAAAVAPVKVDPMSMASDGAPIVRLDDMDASPIPNYDDYFAALAETQELGRWLKPALPYQTARGCWWGEKSHCTFCGISRTAMKFRSKSADQVIEQILALKNRYGNAVFQGTEYIFDYKYFRTLLPRLKEVDAYFRFEVKANLKLEQMQAFVDSGTLEVQPGVESLHDETLALLKKGVRAFQNILLLKRARRVGLRIYWNMLHNIPGERDEWHSDVAELIPLLTHLDAPHGFAEIHYDRFSPYWREPERYGLELRPAYGYEYVYPFPPDVLKDFAYFFETPRQRSHVFSYGTVRQAGLLRMHKAAAAWQEAWQKREPPLLLATNLGDTTEFTDTRAVSVEPRFQIAGLEHRIYWAAEEGVLPDSVAATLQAADPAGATVEAITQSIASLVAKKVLIRISGRLLSIGVAAPMVPIGHRSRTLTRAQRDPPWAQLKAEETLDRIRPSLAASCVRLPNQPLSDWLGVAADGANA